MSDGFRAKGFGAAVLLSLLGTLGCGSTTITPVSPEQGRASYEIECVRVGDCWREASRACKGAYKTVHQSANHIPESELPGLNGLTERNARDRNGFVGNDPGMVPAFGPGIESRDPMPLTQVVVVCT
jgi:hypothetical protein